MDMSTPYNENHEIRSNGRDRLLHENQGSPSQDSAFNFRNELPEDMNEGFNSPNPSMPKQNRPMITEMKTFGSRNERSTTFFNRAIHRESLLRQWWREIVCCVLTVGALIAMFATLYPFHDRTLPSWPYDLSINTLLAIWVVILKAAMFMVLASGLGQLKWAWFRQAKPLDDLAKYDDASRGGIWGSLNLVWTLRGRHIVSTVGALVMVVALAIDPVSQQLVRYYTCPETDTTNPPSIPKTNSYNLGAGSFRIGALLSSIPGDLQAAINSGVFNPASMQVQSDCPTGNCTWTGEYYSSGYCNKCIDISDQITINETTGSTTFTLPSGVSALAGANTLVMGPSNDSIQIVFGFYTGPGQDEGHFLECNGDNSTWGCRGYGAAQCSFSPCVRGYNGAVTDGIFTENQLSSSANWGPASSCLSQSTVDMSCVNSEQKTELLKAGYKFDNSTKWLAYNVTFDSEAKPEFCSSTSSNTTSIVPKDCIYQTSVVTQMSLDYFLPSFFDGNVSFGVEAIGGSIIGQHLLNNGNVSFQRVADTFANVSNAMTSYMRQNGDPNATTSVLGTSIRWDTCVRVRWAWLTLPACLVILTLLFFVCMVIETRQKEVEITESNLGGTTSAYYDYKTSALPLMFHGLDQATQDRYIASLTDVDEMTEQAKNIYVRLAPTEKGWKFVETNRNNDGY